jgi:PAS domain S-box-containing protein
MIYIKGMANSKLAFGALIALAPDGKVFYWNPGAEASFGYTSEEAVGHSLYELIVPPKASRKKSDGRLLKPKSVVREPPKG